MGELIYDLLLDCAVRLTVPQGHGTGFFVAPGLILTCAHVVEEAKTRPCQVTARYRERDYPAQIIQYRPEPYTDLALLHIELAEHPCVCLNDDVQPGDRLYAYGYTGTSLGGDSVTVEYEGPTMLREECRLLKFKGGQIIPGYSGAPLLNTRTLDVCGVVQSSRGKATDLGGGGIPVDVVFAKLPDLEQQNSAFHKRDTRWAEARSKQAARARPPEPPAETKRYDISLYSSTGNRPKPEKLSGRSDLVAEVNQALDEGKQVLLTGYGGTGKTVLARAVVTGWIDRGKGPVIWLRPGNGKAEAQAEAEDVIDAIATELEARDELEGKGGDARVRALQHILACSRADLLALDDVRHGETLAQLREAIRDSGVALLVTSRQAFTNVDHKIEVTDLLPGAALELLTDQAQNAKVSADAYRADPDSAELCRELGGHALGLVIAGAWLKHRQARAGDLLKRIAAHHVAPSTIPTPSDFVKEGRQTVKVVLDDAFFQLEPAVQRLFKVFGKMFEPRATAGLLMEVAGLSDELAFEDARQELGTWNFVDRDDRLYTMHDMVHSYAETVVFGDATPDRGETIAAVQRYVIRCAHDADSLALDQPNILAAARAAPGPALVTMVSVLVLGGYPEALPPSYLDVRGHSVDLLACLDLAIAAAQKMGPERASLRHYLLSKRGNGHFDRGELDAALKVYQAAFDLAPSPYRQVVLLSVMGKVRSEQGQVAEADAFFARGRDLAEANGDDQSLGFVLEQQCYAAGRRGDAETAYRCATEGVEVQRRMAPPDPVGLALALFNQGTAGFDTHARRALSAYSEAYDLAERHEDYRGKANALCGMGYVYHALERGKFYDRARECLDQGRVLWHELGCTAEEREVTAFMSRFGYLKAE